MSTSEYEMKIGTHRYQSIVDNKPVKVDSTLTNEQLLICIDFIRKYDMKYVYPTESIYSKKDLMMMMNCSDLNNIESILLKDGTVITCCIPTSDMKMDGSKMIDIITKCANMHNIIMTTVEVKNIISLIH